MFGTRSIKFTIKPLVPDMEHAREMSFDSGTKLDMWLGKSAGYTTASIRSNGGHLLASDNKRHFIVVQKGNKKIIKPEQYEYYLHKYYYRDYAQKFHKKGRPTTKEAKKEKKRHTDHTRVAILLNLINEKYVLTGKSEGGFDDPVINESPEFKEIQALVGGKIKD